MHPLDRAAGLLLRVGPRRLRFFADGWGDLETVAGFAGRDPTRFASDPIDIAWGMTQAKGRVAITDGWFPSPAQVLPERSRRAYVRRVDPAAPATRYVLLMAAWNDHGWSTRMRLARHLAELRIGSLLLENPFYGQRRPVANDEQPIRTVADFAAMGLAAVVEGRALLEWAMRHGVMCGVSGYSMGGNIAAFVSAVMPFPVATAPLAPSHSPGPVFLDGVLRHGISWSALAARPDPERTLSEYLRAASVLSLPAPGHAPAAILIAARRDGYVPRQAVLDLHAHWSGSELRWAAGGHATLLWLHRAVLAAAIRDSFDRIERLGAVRP